MSDHNQYDKFNEADRIKELNKANYFGRVLAFFWMLLGVMAIGGSLMSKNLTEAELGNLFTTITWPLVFFFAPLLYLKCRSKMNISNGMITAIVLCAIGFSGFAQFTQTYNYFIQAEESMDKKLNDIVIIYENKMAILPAMTASIEGYNTHEKEIISQITKARTGLALAQTPSEQMGILRKFENLGKSLAINVESYPNLKGISAVIEFMRSTKELESEVKSTKLEYNEEVGSYNKSIKVFPYVLIADYMDLNAKDYFSERGSLSEVRERLTK